MLKANIIDQTKLDEIKKFQSYPATGDNTGRNRKMPIRRSNAFRKISPQKKLVIFDLDNEMENYLKFKKFHDQHDEKIV